MEKIKKMNTSKTKMKNGLIKSIFTATFLALTLSLSAQGELINRYLDEYEADEEFVKVSINSRMFSLFTEMEGNTQEEKDFLEAASKLKGLKILASDSATARSRVMYEKASKDVDKAGYEELMTVKDAEEDIKFSIKEKDGIIEELIMVVGGNEQFVFLSLYGEINLKTVSKLASSMRVNGLDNLRQLDDND